MPLSLSSNFEPIDQHIPIYQDFLEDLQGNILNGHGRDRAVHIFLTFKPDKKTQVKTWISNFANSKITSAKSQLDASEEYKISKTDAGLFSHFALSASGYDYLEVPKSKQPHGSKPQNRPDTVPDPTGDPAPFYADSFQQGMKSRQTVLLDPPVEQWEEGFKASIDAVIILAADNPADLANAEIEVSKELIDLAAIATVETGLTLRRKFETTVDGADIQKKFGNVVEHFGYADGVSQPAFLQQKLKGVSQEIGADYDIDRNGKEKDFIYGTLYESLLKRSRAVVPFSLASDKYSIDRVLQLPIAVKVEAELSGMFSPDKYSSLPGLIEAIREDIGLAQGNDRNRRLFVAPNVKVLNLDTQDAVVRGVRVAVNDPVGQGEELWNNPLPVAEQGMVVLAANCINSTRLARNFFPRPAILTPERMEANLMVHIRGNYLWQVRRTVLEAIDPTLVNPIFEQAALQIEGTAVDLGAGDRTGRFHFQFYAAPNAGGNAEEYLYQMMPDRDDLIETIEKLRGVTDDREWVTLGRDNSF